ncbi:MAG: FtsX-like permease family protein [Chloroflexota bacterium]
MSVSSQVGVEHPAAPRQRVGLSSGIHWNFIRRQLTTARQQSLIFVLCVALALVTLVGLNSFGDSVNKALLTDARELQAADVIIDTVLAPTDELLSEIDTLVQGGGVEATQVVELFTVSRSGDDERSLLTQLKIIEPAYPFYGVVELASQQPLNDILGPGVVVAEQQVLDRLGLAVGDSIQIGEADLTVGDVLIKDPVQPVNFFAFGPKVLVSVADKDSLDLIKPGSRIDYDTLLKVDNESRLESVAEQLSAVVDPELDRVRTYRTAQSGLQGFFDNLLFFLSLVAIFILILAGIGIQSALTAFLQERDNTVAIVKTVGGTNRFVLIHFLWVIVILGAIGTGLGLLGGVLLQRIFPVLLADFLPDDVTLQLSPRILIESLILSAVVVGIFTVLPLDRLKELRPSFILRKEAIPTPKDWGFYGILLLLILFFAGMVLWQLNDLWRSLYFVGGTLLLVVVTAGITEAVLFFLRRQDAKQLDVRQALRGLFRPRNATRAVIITLAAALAVIFTIYLLEENLDGAFVSAYPEDAPNAFFIDIQPDQRDGFVQTVGTTLNEQVADEVLFYPVVRGSIVAINGETVDRDSERERDSDNLSRLFNLTYRDFLLEDERLMTGRSLFGDSAENSANADLPEGAVPVSVLDEVFDVREFKIGDQISFRIQGLPVEAVVTSVRTRINESISPFFYFTFQPEVLEAAPQSIFTALRLPKESIAPLQNEVVARYPNISVIDVTEAISSFAETARKLSQVIRFLTFFSIAAGLLIIVSSVYATRFARIQEAVYFKVLGAKSRFVLRVFAMENLFLGLLSAVIALLMAQISSWAICYWVFDIQYLPQIGASFLMIVVTVLLVMGVGLAASLSILRERPIVFLREQGGE